MSDSNAPNLTKREKEVCSLIALDMTYPQVADVLEISVHTVKSIVENIGDKLPGDMRDRTKILAYEYGRPADAEDAR